MWYSPPSRREATLVLFSLTIFVLFYNLESFFTDEGPDTRWDKNPRSDREDWDQTLYGNWTWEEGQVAQNAQKHNETSSIVGPVVSFRPQVFGSVGVNDGILDWGDDVPVTTVLKHAPGHTIMDNLLMLNGTLFIVTDDPAFPPLASIASSGEDSRAPPRSSDWQMLSKAQARETLGSFGGLVHGVSWLVADASPGNYTLFSLWRTYSALDTSLSADRLRLPPPRRIFYPNVPTFVGEQPAQSATVALRQRSPSGFHPFLAKAAFPMLGLMYKEDWADYALLHVPFLIKRVVVVDQGAAHRERVDIPSFAVPLVGLKASKTWWEPIRRNVARFLEVAEQAPGRAWLTKTQTIVTYLSRQDALRGPKMREADHEALVDALRTLGNGYTVHIVSSEASWVERMTAIAQSTVVIGVYGEHMVDSIYIAPSSRATVVEIFSPNVFTRDLGTAVNALEGVRYFAWRGGRQHDVDALPPVAPLDGGEKDEVPVDVSALMKAIRRIK